MTPDVKREVYRKLLHMSMGLFALALRWLTPWQAALCALAALLHNLYLFPFYGYKKFLRPEEKARGYSGMIGYPAVVLVLILLGWGWAVTQFGPRYSLLGRGPAAQGMGLVAAAWAFLAVGDAFGALCGLFLRGPRLPWNPRKTWSGIGGCFFFGTLAAFLAGNFVSDIYEVIGCVGGNPKLFSLSDAPLLVVVGVVAAIVESLDGQLDDNLTVPTIAWLTLALAFSEGPFWMNLQDGRSNLPWSSNGLALLLLLNAALAAIAFWRGWVDRWGFLLGLVFGAVVAFGTGIPGYAILLLFYLVANGSTYYGKKVKEQRGIAEAHGGQRRTGSVFSKGFAPALFALLSFPAFVASLATYAADTAASEFGKTSSGKTFSLKQWKVVPAGSVGAISLKGTLAGLLTLGLFAAGTWAWYGLTPEFTLFAHSEFPFVGFAFATLLCFFFESWFNEWNAPRQYFFKEVIHVMLGFLAGMLTYAPDVMRAVFLALKGTLP